MQVEIKGKDNMSTVTKVSSLSDMHSAEPCAEEEDEVDGKEIQQALQSIKKLMFLKIILLDIGISLGDVVTDILQGLSLIFDENWKISPTGDYGMIVLLTCWLPGPVMLLHMGLHQASFPWLHHKGTLSLVFLSLLMLLFFPLVPTLLYIGVLISKHRLYTRKEMLLSSEHEQRANQVKSITGVIESPLQIVVMGMLMLKGVVVFPWNQEVSSACIEDELERKVTLIYDMQSIYNIYMCIYSYACHQSPWSLSSSHWLQY